MIIASLRVHNDRRYGVHGEMLRRKTKEVEIYFNVECVSNHVDQPTHMIEPAGSMINRKQVIKEIVERILSSTKAGVTESQLRLEWEQLEKDGTTPASTMVWKILVAHKAAPHLFHPDPNHG